MSRVHRVFGWTLLAISFLLGAAIETLLGMKAAAIHDPLRHELWTLAHFHAAFLGLFNLLYPLVATLGKRTTTFVIAGSVLLPLGFLAGGIGHPEGDPSGGILLAPIGAVLLCAAAVEHAVRSRRE